MGRLVLASVTAKGAVMAALLWAVLNSGLSDFEKAIIIAAVSATITGIFTVIGAAIAVRMTRRMHGDIHDVKRKLDADRRQTDHLPEEEE